MKYKQIPNASDGIVLNSHKRIPLSKNPINLKGGKIFIKYPAIISSFTICLSYRAQFYSNRLDRSLSIYISATITINNEAKC